MRGIGKIRRFAEQAATTARTAFRDRAVILLYHRIAKSDADPWELCVSPKNFEAHLDLLEKSHRVISLQELVANLAKQKVPPNAVVITFDDGYADNLLAAKPLLDRFNLPATVFVTSGAIGSKIDFWWDQLVTLLLVPEHLPPVLRLQFGARTCTWETADRTPFFNAVYFALRKLDHIERQHRLDEIAGWLRADAGWRCRNAILTPDQLRDLARDGRVEIGAHTVNHPVLADVPLDEQRREAEQSRRDLAELTGREIVNFAYPHGSRRDFTAETACLVAETGFASACAAENGIVLGSSDHFALPRVAIGDWDGAALEKNLRQWLRS